MIAYASWTSNRRNLAALRAKGWRVMLSPFSHNANRAAETGIRYALDNGAWRAHMLKAPFDGDAFERAVDLYAADADWLVLPDIVGGGAQSLEFSLSWIDRLDGAGALMLAVQDGLTPAMIEPHLFPLTGLFLGGTTEWKLRTMAEWGHFAAERRLHFHVGRVNTVRRVFMCAAAGAHSFDGSSVSRYAVNLPKLENARSQPDLFRPRVS